jgi:hypothetical protein
MKTRTATILLFVTLMITMACTIGYEGVAIGSDPEIEKIEDMTATAEKALPSIPEQAVATLEPPPQPAAPQESQAETENAGTQEYTVTATNFDCICQVDGNVTVEFNFKGDQLEVIDTGGGVTVYEKIGENTYKRSWMGYYILSSGSGDNVTETEVEEERSSVIIFNDSGYIMEQYQGSSSSPCCFHTFAQAK